MAYTISRKSWHYRLYRFHQEELTSSRYIPRQICLCPYMRALLIWLPLKVGLGAVLASAVLWLIGWIVYGIWITSTVAGWLLTGKILLGIAAFVAAALGILIGFEAAKERVREFASDMEHYEPKGIVGQWLKSFHGKICPCFDVTD